MLPNGLRIHDKNPMNNKTVRLFFLSLFLVMTACTSSTDSLLQPTETRPPAVTSDLGHTIFFPRQEKTEGERAVMEALVRSTLVLVDNCIRLQNQSDEVVIDYLLIWPPDFNISNENGAVNILDENNNIVASIGDKVEMGGGEIHLLSLLDEFIQEQVPPQCPGPYWMVGDEFTQINQTETYPSAFTPDPRNIIHFPRQKRTNGEWAAMDALTRGTLVLADNCIRLERDETLANYLLIWPPDFDISHENDTIEILNGDEKMVATLGDRVEMSGGEIHSLSMLDKYIQEQVPPQCPGPHWIMGYELTTIDTSSP
jgi:hypothetical protein